MDIMSSDEESDSIRNSKLFVGKYEKYLHSVAIEAKRRRVSEQAQQFSQRYDISTVSKTIENDMMACNDEKAAYDYLVSPDSFISRYYVKLMQTALAGVNELLLEEVLKHGREFLQKIDEARQSTRGSVKEWSSYSLFPPDGERPSRIIASNFLRMLQTGSTMSSSQSRTIRSSVNGGLSLKANFAFLEL